MASRSRSRPLSGITIDDLSLTFPTEAGALRVLDGVKVEIPSGQVTALIGPNGSGKSTLLRVIAGLLHPTVGQVHIGSRRVAGPDPDVGFVFQEPRLLPWRDVRANIGYPLELAGWPRARREERVEGLLGLVGLRGFEAARPHTLSGGMRQRVAIARALALEPSVLLLDEPFSALDAITRERFNLELLRIWERTGQTIVLVTHSIAEAVFVADRVVVLSPRPGSVVADVPVDLPRPRVAETLDTAAFSAAATRIRGALQTGEEEGSTPVDRATLRPGSAQAIVVEKPA